jgi:hypothetical protein
MAIYQLRISWISLEPAGNEDSVYVFKIVLACLLRKQRSKTSCDTIFHNLGGG